VLVRPSDKTAFVSLCEDNGVGNEQVLASA